MTSALLRSPAGYITSFALAFSNGNGNADQVSAANPLPITPVPFSADTPLEGVAAASGVAGPFRPQAGRAIMLTLAGTWAGQVKLLRSTDGGSTKLPLTAMGAVYGTYTANICEPVWEESEAAALLYLDLSLTSGSLIYRMGQ